MKRVYIADDGKVFESERECERYELYNKLKDKKMAVVADHLGNVIPFDQCYTLDDNASRFYEAFFLYAASPNQYKNLYEAMYFEYGCEMPEPDQVQTYPAALYYDGDKDEWVDFTRAYTEIMDKKRIFENMKEALHASD